MGLGVSCLDHDESLVLSYPIGKGVRHGPNIACYVCANAVKINKTRLTETEYLKVNHNIPEENNSVIEIIEGPGLFELGNGYDTIDGPYNKIKLTKDSYVKVVDNLTGEFKIIEGPALYTPRAFETCSQVFPKYCLTENQYILIIDKETGEKTVRRGPDLYTPGPDEECSEIQDMIVLNDNCYIYVTHEDTGRIDIVEGHTIFCPGPYDKMSPIQKKIVLSLGEYIKIVDNNSGVGRIEKGPATIVLKPYEIPKGDKKRALEVNHHQAVYIFNVSNGQYELITEHGMFIPSPTQNIIETRKRICLEPHEVVVVVDKEGKYAVMRGIDETRSFFLPPYCHILTQEWSDSFYTTTTTKVSRFDTRPQYTDFEFLIRTRDNVEIILDLNFYWQILDVEKMVCSTKDPAEDICKHAMSQILSETSRKDMKEFMESFNEIVQSAIVKDDGFFSQRGVIIHKVEITGRRCKDESTESIFHSIIKEKTNRIKNLEKKDGENEIRTKELEGRIKAEELTGKLVGVKKSYQRGEAQADGEAEASRVANFLETLPSKMSMQQRVNVYFDQQNTERVKLISHQGTNLYVTPQDLDFKISNMNIVNQNDKNKQK